MKKNNLPNKLRFLCLYAILLSCVSCDEGLFGGSDDDMTEEEYLAMCKAAIAEPPEVKEFYHENEEDHLHDSRNFGSSALAVKKKENVWRVIVKPALSVSPEAFPFPEYLDGYADSLFLDVSGLPVDDSDPGNEYWIIDISFPATNIGITYEVFYECEDGERSEPTVFALQTPDICEIHPLWEAPSDPGGNIYKDQNTLNLKFGFRPGSGGTSYSMVHFPYEKVTSTAYISSGSYTYVYQDFLDNYRVPDYPEQSHSFPEYINEITVQIDLHELTGISEEQWEAWQETVTIEAEIQICDEDFLLHGPGSEARFHLAWWHPNQ